MNFKKLLICSVSLAMMSVVAYVLACGWFIDPDMGYTSYFRQDIPEKNNYYYSYLNYYDDDADKTSDKEQNIKEWKKYLGGRIAEKDIEHLLYGVPLSELQKVYKKAIQRQWNSINETWAANGMMQRIIRLRDMNTLNYLLYAKACEQQAGKRVESWNYTPPFDTKIQDSLLLRGLELYKGAQSEFIRLRYAFQVVRMAYYAGHNEDCVNYYHEMVDPEGHSNALAVLWALSFYAGAVDSPVESAYCFSKVFDRCPRYSHEAMTSFRWMIHDIDTAWILQLCDTNYEKAVIHAMTGFTCFYPTLEPLKHVHDVCPTIPYIETLLIREINKIEDGLSTTHSYTNDSLNHDEVISHARALKDLAVRYAGLREVQKPALWYTAAAYLAYLLGEYEQANLLTDIAEREHPEEKVIEQLLAVRLLTETVSVPFDSIAEARILPSIQWLFNQHQKLDPADKNDAFFDRTLAHYFAEKLPGIYLAAGKPVKAALCTGIAEQYTAFASENMFDVDAFEVLDKYASIPQLKKMLQQLTHVDSLTAYDIFLYEHNRFKDDAVLELAGTKLMRELRFDEAAVCFEQLSNASPLFHLEYDPFAEPPVGGGINYQIPVDSLPFSKLNFAVEMGALQSRIRQTKKPAPEDVYRYANGLYQMSWFGNSWQLLAYHWSHADTWTKPWQHITSANEMYHYYYLEQAKKSYVEAAEHSRDKDFKARCLFMAAHCYQMNVSDIYAYQRGKSRYGTYFLNNPYFKELSRKYRKTAFYEDAITRCSYLSDFVHMKKER